MNSSTSAPVPEPLAYRWTARRRAAAPMLRPAAAAAAVLAIGAVGYVGAHALQGDGGLVPRWPLGTTLDSGTLVGTVAADAVSLEAVSSGAGSGAVSSVAIRARDVANELSPSAANPRDVWADRFAARKLAFAAVGDTASARNSTAAFPAAAASMSNAPAFRPSDFAADLPSPAAALAGLDSKQAASEVQPSVVASAAAPDSAGRNVEVAEASAPPMALAPTPTSPGLPAPPAPLPSTTQPQAAHVIRNGTMEFEVDRFDSAVATLTRIVQQAGGFVATTNSDTLPNGKVKGLVVLRLPPDHLDSLVQSLRALGDLKSQQISADDVTKQYTDLQAELTADRAMQDRLLELMKSADGQIKDLLAVEKELAVWKGKIEKAEGAIRYYDNLVSMSTLTITLVERDIQAPATVLETETADLGIETPDVEHHYADAMTAVRAARGRIIESELKRYDAGQLAGRIVAEVPSESAGTVIDRLEQLGRVVRMQDHVQQSDAGPVDPSTDAPAGGAAVTPVAKRQPTRLLVSLYNLANVAPRRNTTMTVATPDVEAAAAALLQSAGDWDGRVVSSAVNRDDPGHVTASIVLEVSPLKIAAATNAIGSRGDVLKLAATDGVDTPNTTESKQGITLKLVSLASVGPRENVQQGLAAERVPEAYHRILDAATAAGATIRTAQLDESDPRNITASLEFDLPRTRSAEVDAAIIAAGQTISRSSARSEATDGTVDSKIGLHLTLTPADHLAPRETTALTLQVSDPARSADAGAAAARSAGGQVLAATVSKDSAGQQTAKVSLTLPADQSADVLTRLRSAGAVLSTDASQDPSAPTGPLARTRVDLTYTTGNTLVAGNNGLVATLRNGLSTSIAGLLWSLQMLVVGFCLVGPWVGIMWVGWKLWRRRATPVATGR